VSIWSTLFWLIIKLLKVLLLISSGSKQPRVQTSLVNIHNRFFGILTISGLLWKKLSFEHRSFPEAIKNYEQNCLLLVVVMVLRLLWSDCAFSSRKNCCCCTSFSKVEDPFHSLGHAYLDQQQHLKKDGSNESSTWNLEFLNLQASDLQDPYVVNPMGSTSQPAACAWPKILMSEHIL